MTSLTIRLAEVPDALAIGETHAASWQEAYADMFEPEFLARSTAGRRRGWQFSIERIVTPPNVLLVAEVDGTVRAFAHAAPADDEGIPSLGGSPRSLGRATPAQRDDRTSRIRGFFGHPVVWGTGVAEELMGQLLQRLRGRYSKVMLWTPRGAQRARGFYEKMGFTWTGDEAVQEISDWTTGETSELVVVQYTYRLADG